VTYSKNTGVTLAGGDPCLVRQDNAPVAATAPLDMIAENIEDLQIAVGIDGLAPFPKDERLTERGAAANDDEWIYNYPGEAMPVGLTLPITALRITVIARTQGTQVPAGLGRPAAEDHLAGAPDGFRRRVLTSTVAVRSIVFSTSSP
jgi:hypothetical protein